MQAIITTSRQQAQGLRPIRPRGYTIGLLVLLVLIAALVAERRSSADTVPDPAAPASNPVVAATATDSDAGSGTPSADNQPPAVADTESSRRLVREGLVVEFAIEPLADQTTRKRSRSITRRAQGRDQTVSPPELLAGNYAEVSFRITEAVNGQPVSGLYPAAWIDISKPWQGTPSSSVNCKDRVALYLQGSVGIRPLIDLNSYYVLVMNQDATITVIDPLVGMTGITKLYALINLKQPGADWIKTADDRQLFVTMPLAEAVAVVDTDTFKVIKSVPAGRAPVRIALQPDETYLWVGNDSQEDSDSGVTVLDRETLRVVAHIPTGKGHHEIAFSDDNRYAFVSNRSAGTVSLIDIPRLTKLQDVPTGPVPIALAYSFLSRALYVADGESGAIAVIDGQRHEVVARVQTQPGLGPLRVTPDGRWAMVVNTQQQAVYVIDTATNQLAHTIAVAERPYQLAFSRAFAYVRSLGSERLSMINLTELGQGREPPVVTFAAGAKAPEQAVDLSLASGIVEAPGEAAVLVVSPADEAVYYYMEGMNAPMGTFPHYGHAPRAVSVVNRALRQEAPGVYAGKVQLPEAGTYDVAFLLDTPRLLHCFSAFVKPNPQLVYQGPALAVEYLLRDRQVTAGDTMRLRFRLTDAQTKQPRSALQDVRVLYYRAPAYGRTEVPAQAVGDGIYEAVVALPRAGAYYLYVAAPSAQMRYGDLSYLTLQAVSEASTQRDTERSTDSGR